MQWAASNNVSGSIPLNKNPTIFIGLTSGKDPPVVDVNYNFFWLFFRIKTLLCLVKFTFSENKMRLSWEPMAPAGLLPYYIEEKLLQITEPDFAFVSFLHSDYYDQESR